VLTGIALWRDSARSPFVFGSVAAALALGAIAMPARLGVVYRAWMGFAHLASKITTPVFMGIVYFAILSPIGLIVRALGRSPLAGPPAATTAWKRRDIRESGGTAPSMERQF